MTDHITHHISHTGPPLWSLKLRDLQQTLNSWFHLLYSDRSKYLFPISIFKRQIPIWQPTIYLFLRIPYILRRFWILLNILWLFFYFLRNFCKPNRLGSWAFRRNIPKMVSMDIRAVFVYIICAELKDPIVNLNPLNDVSKVTLTDSLGHQREGQSKTQVNFCVVTIVTVYVY